ncbi:creatininase family protein [Paenibacillus sp. UNC499MF]|uniref:creatininase family protein n=1 Tax=Paenibacillus sp. UNC499MF TaxID=1502751 RepID=UPI00089F8FAD|nr:creatininase family protein [Paenibacillus sp. UNC499MF]SEG25380.1 creatinine amidohydrolase [Paenibacillus sp. UNC499MF]
MAYSLFEKTMADMSWTEIEAAIMEGAVVLLPSGVIEQQGPHICTGKDIYESHLICKLMLEELEAEGIRTLIAPPFYWGINQITGSFTGSFTARTETVQAMLYDIFDCLGRWGIHQAFLVDVHGDHKHGMALYEAIKEARIRLQMDVKSVISHWIAEDLRIQEDDEHFLIFQVPLEEPRPTPFPDIHAGENGTASMRKHFPGLVDEALAQKLPPARLTFEHLKEWQRGGQHAKELTPLGYFGAPADYKKVPSDPDFIECFARFAAVRIKEYAAKRGKKTP